jgi:four helix bundle protein
LSFSLDLALAQSEKMNPRFDHERLTVYQTSLKFVAWSTQLVSTIEGRPAVRDQLDRASTSVPLNIAEGNGKFAIRDRCRYLDFARGSALECAACLDVLVAKQLIEQKAISDGKQQLFEVVSMLMGLINSLNARAREQSGEYFSLEDQD